MVIPRTEGCVERESKEGKVKGKRKQTKKPQPKNNNNNKKKKEPRK
jgi:hypothetical protein